MKLRISKLSAKLVLQYFPGLVAQESASKPSVLASLKLHQLLEEIHLTWLLVDHACAVGRLAVDHLTSSLAVWAVAVLSVCLCAEEANGKQCSSSDSEDVSHLLSPGKPLFCTGDEPEKRKSQTMQNHLGAPESCAKNATYLTVVGVVPNLRSNFRVLMPNTGRFGVAGDANLMGDCPESIAGNSTKRILLSPL